VKFSEGDFTSFTGVSRICPERLFSLVSAVCTHFNLHLVGIDVICTAQGDLYVLDCNYWPTFQGVPPLKIQERFDRMAATNQLAKE
jgi:glutathione synthase/RimK-type ligase-like ATP-grasp enzyme